jgi:hypothetical protein
LVLLVAGIAAVGSRLPRKSHGDPHAAAEGTKQTSTGTKNTKKTFSVS